MFFFHHPDVFCKGCVVRASMVLERRAIVKRFLKLPSALPKYASSGLTFVLTIHWYMLVVYNTPHLTGAFQRTLLFISAVARKFFFHYFL